MEFKNDKVCIDLLTGDLIKMKKLSWEDKEHDAKIIQQNNITRNIKVNQK